MHDTWERARLSVLRRISAASSCASISDRLAALRSARTPSYAVCCARSFEASSWTRARSSAAAACSSDVHTSHNCVHPTATCYPARRQCEQ